MIVTLRGAARQAARKLLTARRGTHTTRPTRDIQDHAARIAHAGLAIGKGDAMDLTVNGIVSWDGSRILKDRDNPRVEVEITEAE